MIYIENFFVELWSISVDMSPYLLLGFLFAGILKVFVKSSSISRHLGGSPLRSAVNASILGVPLPLCSCGVIPTGISLFRQGASKSATVSFLISTPQTGIDSIMATWSLMGLPLAIIRPVAAFISGIFGGVATSLVKDKEQPLSTEAETESSCGCKSREKEVSSCCKKEEEEAKACSCEKETPAKTSCCSEKETPAKASCCSEKETPAKTSCCSETPKKEGKFTAMMRYAFIDFIADIAIWLLVGILLAALISVAIPPDFFSSLALSPLMSMLVIVLVSIPLYICATGSIPVAAALIMKGLSPGAAFVLLMAGPATNIATMTVLWKTLGKKTTIIYVASIVVSAIIWGMVIDYLLPASWFSTTLLGHACGSSHIVPQWLGVSSTIALYGLILYALTKKYIAKLIGAKRV